MRNMRFGVVAAVLASGWICGVGSAVAEPSNSHLAVSSDGRVLAVANRDNGRSVWSTCMLARCSGKSPSASTRGDCVRRRESRSGCRGVRRRPDCVCRRGEGEVSGTTEVFDEPYGLVGQWREVVRDARVPRAGGGNRHGHAKDRADDQRRLDAARRSPRPRRRPLVRVGVPDDHDPRDFVGLGECGGVVARCLQREPCPSTGPASHAAKGLRASHSIAGECQPGGRERHPVRYRRGPGPRGGGLVQPAPPKAAADGLDRRGVRRRQSLEVAVSPDGKTLVALFAEPTTCSSAT